MKYLALDQALQTTGWALFNNSKLQKFGKFTIPANKPIEQRLGQYYWKELNELYAEYEFEELFIEDIQYQNNAETYKKLAYVQCCILLWAYFKEIKVKILSPSHWRSLIKDEYKIPFGRARQEQKEKAVNFVNNHYNVLASSDEADAICIGCAGLIEQGQNKSAF